MSISSISASIPQVFLSSPISPVAPLQGKPGNGKSASDIVDKVDIRGDSAAADAIATSYRAQITPAQQAAIVSRQAQPEIPPTQANETADINTAKLAAQITASAAQFQSGSAKYSIPLPTPSQGNDSRNLYSPVDVTA